MRKLAVAGLALPFAALAALTLVVVLLSDAAAAGADEPSQEALADIPPYALDFYEEAVAVRCPTMSWSVLAAVAKIESDHGRIDGAALQPGGRVEPRILGPTLDGTADAAAIPDTDGGSLDGDDAWDRAVGPLQFLPATWERHATDGSGDGITDIDNLADAAHTAAMYLCSTGGGDPDRLRHSLWSYNRDWTYVREVLELATLYVQPGIDLVPAEQVSINEVLEHPDLHIYEAGRADVATGRIDPRVLRLLLTLAEDHTIHVSSLQTGHSKCVGGGSYQGCTVSHHWYGRAVDIYKVDGAPVSPSNGRARRIVSWIATLEDDLRPDEVGSPWGQFDQEPGFFTDLRHQGHLHIGYR